MCNRNKTDMHIPRVLAALGLHTNAAQTKMGVSFIILNTYTMRHQTGMYIPWMLAVLRGV